MANDEGLSGKEWLSNYSSGGGSRMMSDYTPRYLDTRQDYNPNVDPVPASSRPSYEYNPATGYGYSTPAQRGMEYSSVFSKGVKKAPAVPYTYTGPKLGYNATPEEVAAMQATVNAAHAPYVPPAANALGSRMGRMYNPYTKFSTEQNKEAMKNFAAMQGRAAARGDLGYQEQGKEILSRLVNEIPLVGGFTRMGGLAEGRRLTGNTPFGRATRLGFDVLGAAAPGYALVGPLAGAGADWLSQTFSPPKPAYEGGLLPNEDVTRVEILPTGETVPIPWHRKK